jgi:hypothetical protein
MLNQNIIHLIYDIFWNMGFKMETQADKIMPIIRVIYIICITLIVSLILIIRIIQDLGLADHVWQGKRTLIAQSVDNLGYQFRPARENASWWSKIECTPLLDAKSNVPP